MPLVTAAALVALTACGTSTHRPAASGATTKVPATWAAYTWPAAGFSVKLPGHPKRGSTSMNLNSIVITLHEFVVKAGAHKVVLVADAHFSEPLPNDQAQAELRSSVYSFAGASGASIKSDRPTTFRSLQGHEAFLKSPHGFDYELVGILKDPTDEIIVLAPKGATFDAVTASLRFL